MVVSRKFSQSESRKRDLSVFLVASFSNFGGFGNPRVQYWRRNLQLQLKMGGGIRLPPTPQPRGPGCTNKVKNVKYCQS